MKIQNAIEKKLKDAINLQYIEVVNESYMHAVPAGSESHFKVVAVSDDFVGKRAVARHQVIYRTLAEEVAGPIHALALHTYTGDEWAEKTEQAPTSPQCAGKSSKETEE